MLFGYYFYTALKFVTYLLHCHASLVNILKNLDLIEVVFSSFEVIYLD